MLIRKMDLERQSERISYAMLSLEMQKTFWIIRALRIASFIREIDDGVKESQS